MTTLLMIADDFTGALDTGVQFASAGARSKVVTDFRQFMSDPDTACDVLVVDAETRHMPASQAYRTVAEIVRYAALTGIPYIYKKTDSALRGNIGAELSAAVDASGAGNIIFMPAYPKIGRQTKKGIHYIDGIPAAQSVFGKDPFEPVRYSDVSELIHSQTDQKTSLCVPDAEELPDDEGIIIFDSETEEDLQKIGELLKKNGRLHLLAGCAGFAAVLPGILGLQADPEPVPDLDRNLLVICGSVNPISICQMNYAEENGFVRCRIPAKFKLDPNAWQRKEGQEELNRIAETFSGRMLKILDVNDVHGDTSTQEAISKSGMTIEEARATIAESLGTAVSLLTSMIRPGTLFVTGGDTLLQIMTHCGIHELIPVCELYPGVVLSKIVLKTETRYVISKSGGFGEETLLVRLGEKLRKE